MSALLFITLLVGLTYAAEECKVNEGHCSKCYDECTCECCAEGYAYSDSVKCDKCAKGYVKDGDNCVKCDAHCTSACTTNGKGKCDYSCESGFYLLNVEGEKNNTCAACVAHCAETQCTSDKKCTACAEGFALKAGADDNTADQCVACEDSNCVACSATGTKQCTKCKDGYKLDGGECKTKYDCTKNNVKNCGECSGEEADAKCYECKDGYKFDNLQTEDAKKCVEEDKLTKCEWTEEKCGKKEEGKVRYQEDFCYLNDGIEGAFGEYYKVEGGKICSYTDSACKDRVKEYKYLDLTDKCIRLKDKNVEPNVDKWYQYKKSDNKCESGEVKEYDAEGCKGDGTATFSKVCRKVEEGEYNDKYVMTEKGSPYFAVYSDADCTKQIEAGDAECEPGPCSGSVMNIIMLTILIISFMI